MDELVETLLADLSHNLDRLADQLEHDQPALARTLRLESRGLEPTLDVRDGPPQRAQLRPTLYDALDAGAVDAGIFDRLMVLESRTRRAR